MAATQYSATAVCSCGSPLKVFASSGRTAYACSPVCSNILTRRKRGQQPRRETTPPVCLDCGAAVWAYTSRCMPCSLTHRRETAAHTFVCEHCGEKANRRPGGANKKKGYVSRWCSMRCKVEAAAVIRNARAKAPERIAAEAEGLRKLFSRKGLHSRVWFGRKCRGCDAPYVARRLNQVACSAACREILRARSPAVSRRCGRCGVPFETNMSTALYCSPKCCKAIERSTRKARRRALDCGVTTERVSPIKVLERDGWCCQICGKDTPREWRGTRYSNAPEVDHRVPLAKGGAHTYENLQCACRACNSRKGATLVIGQIPLFNKHLPGGW